MELASTETYTYNKLEFFSGGYGSNSIHIIVDTYGNYKVEQRYANGDIIVSATKEHIEYTRREFNAMMKIIKIVNTWKDYYDQPGLCDGPEIIISIDDKKTYIHSVSSKYYPKHYKTVIQCFNILIEFSGVHI